MSKLIMMRHGESQWNALNFFTGWVDIPLSLKGIQEAFEGGKLIANIPIDIIFTSSLMRAQMTAMLAMAHHSSGKVPRILQHPGQENLDQWSRIYNEEAERACVPVVCAWELNERMYGELQGLNKADTVRKFGAEQVQIWRRSYDVAPPHGESLQMTAARSIPYFNEKIVPYLAQGHNVFISAHGNSLRSIVMEINRLSKEEVLKLEIATGIPMIYDYADAIFTKEELRDQTT